MKTLKINNLWRVETDNDSSTLIKSEQRIRKDGKSIGQKYTFEQPYYYNNIQSALSAYLLKSLDTSKEVKDITKIVDKSLKEIKLCINNCYYCLFSCTTIIKNKCSKNS
jgi:hypothetical protein